MYATNSILLCKQSFWNSLYYTLMIAVCRVHLVRYPHSTEHILIMPWLTYKARKKGKKVFLFFLFTGTWWWKSALHWSRSLHLYREDYGAQHWPQGKFEIQMMQFRQILTRTAGSAHQMHWNQRENGSQNFLITSRETKVSISIWNSSTTSKSRNSIWFMHEVSEKFLLLCTAYGQYDYGNQA